MRATSLLLAAAALATLLAGCGGGDDSPGAANSTPVPVPAHAATLRLGYFPNITHAQAVIGVADGSYQAALGDTKLETKTFNAGPAAVEALYAGELDAAYLGPNPAVNGFVRSHGEALRIVAGGASGGALFVVRGDSGIAKAADLANKKLATPQMGGTQDVALRAYLKANGLKPKEDGGNVTVLPTANGDTLTLMKRGDIDGAWAPEPWATRLVQEAGARVFLDERTLWPNGDFATTVLVVNTDYLKKYPEAVERLVAAHVQVTKAMADDPAKAKQAVNAGIKALTGAGLAPAIIDAAWQNLRFTNDPLAASITKQAGDSFDLGLLGVKKPDLKELYDLTILDRVLAANGLPAVAARP